MAYIDKINYKGTEYDLQDTNLKEDLSLTVGKENLLNGVTWTTGQSIGASGSISSTSGFRYSSLIPVETGFYTFIYVPNGTNRNTRVHGYDSNGDWVRQIEYHKSNAETTQLMFTFWVDGVSYIRISTGDTTYTDAKALVYGIGSNYDEITTVKTNITDTIDDIVVNSGNLFDSRQVVDGSYVGGDYFVGPNSAYSYIKLKLDEGNYIFADLDISANTDTIIVYDGDGLTTATPSMTTTNKYVSFTVPADTKEVAISYRNASVNKESAMIVAGSIVPQEYIPYGYRPNLLDLNSKTVIVVDANGDGNYTSFTEAIQSITDSDENNRYEVQVHEGTYDIVTEFFGGTITAVEGLVIPDYVDVVGIGNVDNIILDGTLPDDTTLAISTAFSTINLRYTNTIKNITVKGTNVRYAVHDESGNKVKNYTRIVENCVFETTQNADGLWAYNSAYGHGLSDGCNVHFKNCKFITVCSTGGVGAYICHDGDGQTKACSVEFENCTFTKTPYASFGTFRVGTYSGQCKSYVNINGCDFNGGAILIKEEVTNSGTGILLIPVGYANRNFTTEITDSTGEYTEADIY